MATFVAPPAAVTRPVIGCPAVGPGELPRTGRRLRDNSGALSRPVLIPVFVVRPKGSFPTPVTGSGGTR